MTARLPIALLAFFLAFPIAAPAAKVKLSKVFDSEIRKNHKVFDRCGTDEARKSKRAIQGIVLVRYVVNGDGKVAESGVIHNTTHSRTIADCVLRALDRMRFTATFGAPATVSHNFKFDLKAKKKK